MNWRDCEKANCLSEDEQRTLVNTDLMLGCWKDGVGWTAIWEGTAWNLYLGDKILFDRCEVYGSSPPLRATHYVPRSEFDLPSPKETT